MSTYNSVALSLDASDHWKKTPKYDLSGADGTGDSVSTSTPNEIRFSSTQLDTLNEIKEVHVSPMPQTFKNERTALMGDDEDVQDVHEKTSKPMLIGSIILSSLFFGFSVGFSLGYAAAENWDVKSEEKAAKASNQMSSLSNIELSIASEEEKVLQFIDKLWYHGSSFDSVDSNDPMMGFPFQGPTTTKRQPVYLNRADAYALLMEFSPQMSTISDFSNDFFLISSGLDAQQNQAYCGAATATAVLNSLRFIANAKDGDDGVFIPVDPIYEPYAYATQDDIFDKCTQNSVISTTGGGPGQDGILTPPFGLNMGQVAALLQCHLKSTKVRDWKVTTQYVDSTHQTVGKLRFDLKNALQDPYSRVLVNYDRSAVGQVGGGHWSPIGSYSEKEDMFLLLDVAKYKYPPTWIPTECLFDGLATEDSCGDWKYPDGQNVLSQEERFASSPDGYAAALAKLQCKKKLRGYIVVSSS